MRNNMPYPTNPSSRAKLTTGHRKLGEIVELHYGKGILKHERKPDGKYPVYGANGVLDYSDKYLIDSEAVIVGRKGSAGEVTRVSGKFWPSDVTYYVLGNDNIDIDYLFHALKNLNLQQLAVGVKPGINRNRVYELKIPLPPIVEQRKIVARLEGLLGKIKEARRLRAEAQEAAQNLLPAELHRIFSQPVRQAQGKQHTNKLEYVGMSGKSASVKNYGEAQWEEKNLEEICEKTTNIKWSDHKNNNFQYVDLTSVSRDDFSIAETKEVNSKNAPSRAKKVIKTNDVIFGTTRPTLMRVTRIPEEFNNHICSTGFTVLRAKKERVLPQFIYYFIRSERFMNRMESVQTGASYPAVSDAKVMETKIPLPPVAEQKKIVARLDSLSEKISSLRQAQAKTASDFISLEQSILSKSFQ